MTATVRLICSETSTEHIVMVSFGDAGDHLLAKLDDLNMALLKGFCASVDEMPRDDGTEIVITL